LLAFSCDKCAEAPYIKDTLGCEVPLKFAALWLSDEDEFYNCPIKFIMQSSRELIEKMDSYKNGLSTPPEFEKQSAKFLLGVRVYEGYLSKFNAMKKGE